MLQIHFLGCKLIKLFFSMLLMIGINDFRWFLHSCAPQQNHRQNARTRKDLSPFHKMVKMDLNKKISKDLPLNC